MNRKRVALVQLFCAAALLFCACNKGASAPVRIPEKGFEMRREEGQMPEMIDEFLFEPTSIKSQTAEEITTILRSIKLGQATITTEGTVKEGEEEKQYSVVLGERDLHVQNGEKNTVYIGAARLLRGLTFGKDYSSDVATLLPLCVSNAVKVTDCGTDYLYVEMQLEAPYKLLCETADKLLTGALPQGVTYCPSNAMETILTERTPTKLYAEVLLPCPSACADEAINEKEEETRKEQPTLKDTTGGEASIIGAHNAANYKLFVNDKIYKGTIYCTKSNAQSIDDSAIETVPLAVQLSGSITGAESADWKKLLSALGLSVPFDVNFQIKDELTFSAVLDFSGETPKAKAELYCAQTKTAQVLFDGESALLTLYASGKTALTYKGSLSQKLEGKNPIEDNNAEANNNGNGQPSTVDGNTQSSAETAVQKLKTVLQYAKVHLTLDGTNIGATAQTDCGMRIRASHLRRATAPVITADEKEQIRCAANGIKPESEQIEATLYLQHGNPYPCAGVVKIQTASRDITLSGELIPRGTTYLSIADGTKADDVLAYFALMQKNIKIIGTGKWFCKRVLGKTVFDGSNIHYSIPLNGKRAVTKTEAKEMGKSEALLRLLACVEQLTVAPSQNGLSISAALDARSFYELTKGFINENISVLGASVPPLKEGCEKAFFDALWDNYIVPEGIKAAGGGLYVAYRLGFLEEAKAAGEKLLLPLLVPSERAAAYVQAH